MVENSFDEKRNDKEFSFLLPTRERPDLVRRFCQSVLETAADPENIEIVLAVDEDDAVSQNITQDRLSTTKIIMRKGLTMGSLNRACYDASKGRYVMLINDDVILRTKNWDKIIISAIARFEDDIALIHTNDLLFKEKLCTFPILSRRACDEIGICPSEYQRYRIDDHIYDTYNILAYLGHRRIVYLPDVIFEHDNYVHGHQGNTGQIFKSDENKVYVPNQEIIESDARIFDKKREERKQDALKLAELINKSSYERKHLVYRATLKDIKDPFGYKRSNFVRRIESQQDDLRKSRTVTVAVVTSDIRKEHARKCLASLKKYTSNFDLVILDNNNSRCFNHPTEMNKVLQMIDTDFLVLMDDDVIVEEGWLEGLLRSIDDDTAIVTPMHKNAHGDISYAGVYLKGDSLGTHAHLLDTPKEPSVTQCVCSAVLLIDMKKCGDILFDPSYRKYFLDLDYSLKVWETGYKVVCTPYSIVTHIGGATMPDILEESSTLVRGDGNIFKEIWINSGRLAKIEKSEWSRFSFLRDLTEIPKRIDYIFKNADNLEFNEFETEIGTLLVNVKSMKLLRDLMVPALDQYILHCKGDHKKRKCCEETLNYLVGKTGGKRMLDLIAKVLMVVLFRLIKSNERSYRLCVASIDMLKRINYRYLRLPLYIRKVTDGAVFRLFRMYEAVRDAEITSAALNEKVLLMKLAWLIKSNERSYRLCVASIDMLKRINYGYLRLPLYVRKLTDEPIHKLFRMYETVRDAAISPAADHSTVAISPIPKRTITQEIPQGGSLFICSLHPEKIKKCLDGLDIKGNLTLLTLGNHKEIWQGYSTICYEDSFGKDAETIDVKNTSEELIRELRARNFDVVIVPYEGTVSWGDVSLENFVATFAKEFMVVFPDGKRRLYARYDDLSRITYNKAYLGSLFRLVPKPRGKKILEVGCSDGLVCDLLLNESPEIMVGVDIMKNVGCNYSDPTIKYARMDGSNLMFKDKTFDLCFSIATLEHCKDPFHVLEEMKRVTKKGGYCYVQVGPLHCSPYGHHMFGYFDDYPWIHLRLSKDEIIEYCKRSKIDEKIQRNLGMSVSDYIYGMIHSDHINGKTFQEYNLDKFMKAPGIKVINFSRSYEGKSLLTEQIVRELRHIKREDLISHGFELVFRIE